MAESCLTAINNFGIVFNQHYFIKKKHFLKRNFNLNLESKAQHTPEHELCVWKDLLESAGVFHSKAQHGRGGVAREDFNNSTWK